MSSRRLLLAPLYAATLLACGHDWPAHRKHGQDDDGLGVPTAPTVAADDAPQAPAAGGADRVIAHAATFGYAYYQRDDRLSDLFATADGHRGESMLCWPVTLAYQARYQAEVRSSSLPKLADVLGSDADTSAQIRSLTALCNTGKNTGTTVPDGAKCIDAMYRQAGYQPLLTVIGLDAKWADPARGSLYPAGTNATRRAVVATDLTSALDNDAGLIALVGFYTKDDTSHTWTRVTGHFFSITGYQVREGGDLPTLHAVNPAQRYPNDGRPHFDKIAVKALDPEESGIPNPKDTALELSGDGLSFPGYTTILESVVVFNAHS